MYSVKEISDKKIWDDFIDAAEPSTFLHSYAWGEVEKDTGRKVYYFGIYNGNTCIAQVLSVVVRARRGDMLIVPQKIIFKSKI
jgi:lipid II:glycine glycyltransferase (peptidoglycan interpeptide bridge formation enzyme)